MLYGTGGEAVLQEVSKQKPNKKNGVEPKVEQAVVDFAYQKPAYGQLWVSNELKKNCGGTMVYTGAMHLK